MARLLSRLVLNVFDMSSNKKPIIKVERMTFRGLLFIISQNGRMLGYDHLSDQTRKGYRHLDCKRFFMLQSLLKHIGTKIYLRLCSNCKQQSSQASIDS